MEQGNNEPSLRDAVRDAMQDAMRDQHQMMQQMLQTMQAMMTRMEVQDRAQPIRLEERGEIDGGRERGFENLEAPPVRREQQRHDVGLPRYVDQPPYFENPNRWEAGFRVEIPARSISPCLPSPWTESVAGLSVDSSKAEGPSKNALKKELKKKQKEEEKRLKEEEKKKKAAAMAAANSQSQKPSFADDEDMDPTQYYESRLKILASQKAGGVNPYPHKFHVSMSIVEYVEKYGSLNDGEHLKDIEVSLAGRIMNKRASSSKLYFYDLYGSGVKVQVMADARDSDMDEVEFARYHAGVKRGDVVGICGYPGKSKRGELSIFPKKFIVLSPCLHMMPRQKGAPGADNAAAEKNGGKGEPQARRSQSATSSSTTSTDRDRRRSEFNSLNVSDMSADSIMRSPFPSLSQRPSNLRTFTFQELGNATRNFSRSLMIGEGGFGCVYRGTIRSSDDSNARQDVAIKQLTRRGLQGHKEWLAEVSVLGVVEHPNLVKLIGYCAEDDERGMQRLLVYEFMPNRSVENHLSTQSTTPLSWVTRLRIALDAARGLTYLHEETDFQIIFRDLKTSNILLDEHWNAKLSDFGLARQGPPEGSTHVSTAVVGTIGYAAPEYMLTNNIYPLKCTHSVSKIGGVPASDQRYLGSSSLYQKFDRSNYKSFCTSLINKVGWQEEALRGISQTIVHCRTGEERRRGASLRGDIWLTFLGPDKVGKKKVAVALAELIYGSKENLICIDLSYQVSINYPNAICNQQEINANDEMFRGKTIVDHIAGELSKKPWSIVFLENVDKADLLVQNSLYQAILTGRFPDSHRREFGITNTIFVMTATKARGKAFSTRTGSAKFSEERILAAQRWKMKLLVQPVSRAASSYQNVNVLIASGQMSKNKQVTLVSKRKMDVSDDLKEHTMYEDDQAQAIHDDHNYSMEKKEKKSLIDDSFVVPTRSMENEQQWSSRSTVEISSISLDKSQFSSASYAINKYRLLVEQLERVDVSVLESNAKLAFWVSIYNSLIIHAYLAFGIPHSSLRRIALFHKAAYNIGGHIITANSIEHSILSCRTPRISSDLMVSAGNVKAGDRDSKEGTTSEDDRSFTFEVGSLAEFSEKTTGNNWKPFSSMHPLERPQVSKENSSLRSSFSEEGVSDEDISLNQSLDVPVPATQSQPATSGKPTPGSPRRSKRLQNKRA